jgi:hypothetical protein
MELQKLDASEISGLGDEYGDECLRSVRIAFCCFCV